MDVLQGEFSTFYNLYYQSEDVRLSPKLIKAIENRNISYFRKLIQEYQKRFELEERKSDRVLIAVFHMMLNRCDVSIVIPDSECRVISDYLMSIDE